MIEVRKTVDNDCRYYVDVHCPEVKALPNLGMRGLEFAVGGLITMPAYSI